MIKQSVKLVNLNKGRMEVLCTIFTTLIKLFQDEKLEGKKLLILPQLGWRWARKSNPHLRPSLLFSVFRGFL